MLNLLLYIYIIFLPLSDMLFNIIYNFNILGISINLIDILYILITFILVINKYKNNKLNNDNIYKYLFIGFTLIICYNPIIAFIYDNNIKLLLISILNCIFKYYPLILLIDNDKINLSAQKLIMCLTISSLIFMILAYNNEYFNDLIYSGYFTTEIGNRSIPIDRAVGFISLGDGNSQALFCTFIFAFTLYAFLEGFTNLLVVILAFIASFINVSYIASRGAFLALLLIILVNFRINIIISKIIIQRILMVIIILFIFTYFNKDKLSLVWFRIFESGITQLDLDPNAKSGRLASTKEGIKYIQNNPNVLLYGDVNGKFNLYGQTVHNGFIKSIHSIGIMGIIWIISFLLYIKKKIGKGYISIIIPFVVSLLTLPDFAFLYYLFYIVLYKKIEDKSKLKIYEYK